MNKTIIIKIGRLSALYFDKIYGKVDKRVVAKETSRIATGRHMTLTFNLHAFYGWNIEILLYNYSGQTSLGYSPSNHCLRSDKSLPVVSIDTGAFPAGHSAALT